MKIRQGFVSNSSSSSFVVMVPIDYVPTPEDAYVFYKDYKDASITNDSHFDEEDIIHTFLDNVERLQKDGWLGNDNFMGDGDDFYNFEKSITDKFGIIDVETGADQEYCIVNCGQESVMNRVKKIVGGMK